MSSETIKQYDLFGEDITEEIKRDEDRRKRSERAKKAAETRKRNREEELTEFNRMILIARSDSDIFGNKYSEKEKANAEEYISNYLRKKNSKKQ